MRWSEAVCQAVYVCVCVCVCVSQVQLAKGFGLFWAHGKHREHAQTHKGGVFPVGCMQNVF